MTSNLWDSHDFKVKMLDWSAARGSRLAFTCRSCGRSFCRFTLLDHGSWAIDKDGRALESALNERWMAEACPHLLDGGSR
ncbi:MAG: hypothetical protein ACREQE_08475 [Candidatus Binataceae bacterium]